MNPRYYVEHEALPHLYFKDPIKIITKLTTEKEQFMADFYLAGYEKQHEPCPFQAENFKVELETRDQVEFIVVTLPNFFIEPTLCHKIVFAYSMNLDLYQYYTLEDGNDPLFGRYMQLCSWMENQHVNYGDFNDEGNIVDKVYQTIML